MRAIRVAACAILVLAACVALWALLLSAGVKAFPADSFLAYPPAIKRQVFNTLAIAGVVGSVAGAVLFVTRWSRPVLASWGLAVVLGGAAILLLAIGADLLSSQDLVRETPDHVQLMFWYDIVGVMQYVVLGCFAIGWALWLGAVLTAWLRRRADA